jgi:hypothetical protein
MEGCRVLLREAEEMKAHREHAERDRAIDARLAQANEREHFGRPRVPDLAQDLRKRPQQSVRFSLDQRRVDTRSV